MMINTHPHIAVMLLELNEMIYVMWREFLICFKSPVNDSYHYCCPELFVTSYILLVTEIIWRSGPPRAPKAVTETSLSLHHAGVK